MQKKKKRCKKVPNVMSGVRIYLDRRYSAIQLPFCVILFAFYCFQLSAITRLKVSPFILLK